MRKIKFIWIIMILIGIISCEKETSYSIKNNTLLTLYGLTSYYLDGTTRIHQTEHGTMWLGTETKIIETDNPLISFSFSYDPDGILYESVVPYSVKKGSHTRFIIDNNTALNGGTTYYVMNFGPTMNNLTTYYWTGTEKLDLVQHGNLEGHPYGRKSRHVRTDKDSITVSWDSGTKTFPIAENTVNILSREFELYITTTK